MPCVAYACKIVFSSMPNLNNYDNIFHKLCLLKYLGKEKVDFVHIWYSNQPQFARSFNTVLFTVGKLLIEKIFFKPSKIAFGSMSNLSNYGHFFIHYCVCHISEKIKLILFIFGTLIRYHVLLMHVK